MELYCGIDLHARTSQVAVDDDLGVHINKKIPKRLEVFFELLQPFDPAPRVVVESTFNWYWLVDGLQDAGFDVTLAHTIVHVISLAHLAIIDSVVIAWPSMIRPRPGRTGSGFCSRALFHQSDPLGRGFDPAVERLSRSAFRHVDIES